MRSVATGLRHGVLLRRRRALRLAALGFVLAALAGCSTSGQPTGSSQPPATQRHPSTPLPTPTPPVADPMPKNCEGAYSPALFAALQATRAPLNDVSMVDVTFSDIPRLDASIRAGRPLVCTWGTAGPGAIVTAVSRITEQRAAAAHTAMQESGFACTATAEAVTCVGQNEEEDGIPVGESHYLRGTIGLSTRWITAPVDGYTEGMVAALWP
ncbi:hypothetical protein [Mycetocola zhadangensis]|nr:hypothetical protein [Mycetocola zhadangensis]GGE81844.1 hypothetical protein GCM10011313_00300 [Mycetocola zhadangensis]